MKPEMFQCCKDSEPLWIFVYENKEVYVICKEHYDSVAHRCFVKDIIKLDTGKHHTPKELSF